MQSVAAFTLSMLLQHIRRYIVIGESAWSESQCSSCWKRRFCWSLTASVTLLYPAGVGFTFHTCLIMVLLMWLPSAEDSALFYVISAAWGVCNAIWETLSFCKSNAPGGINALVEASGDGLELDNDARRVLLQPYWCACTRTPGRAPCRRATCGASSGCRCPS